MLSHQPDIFSLIEEPLDKAILYSKRADEFEICEFLAKLDDAKYFGLDTETYGRNEKDGLRPYAGLIRLIQIALPDGSVAIFDLGGHDDDRDYIVGQLEKADFWYFLGKACSDPNKLIVGQNLKFDCRWLQEQYDIECRGIRDVMLMSQLLWAGVQHYRHSLKAIAMRVLGEDIDKGEQNSAWGWPLTTRQLNYAAKDVQILIPLFKAIGKMVKDQGLLEQAIIECEALPVFVNMEVYGMPVDYAVLENTLSKFQEAQEKLLSPFTERFPGVSPTASSQQLIPLFNSELGTHLDSTEDAELQKYSKMPEIQALIIFRTLKKNIDYLLGMKANYRDGHCRGSYRQLAPKGFGRSTCSSGIRGDAGSGINLQNCPKHPSDAAIVSLKLPPVRGCFRPPWDYSLLVADLSQCHLRVATEASRDPNLLAAYNDGMDMHVMTAVGLAKARGYDWDYTKYMEIYKDHGHPDWKTAKELRNIAKNVMYGSLNVQGKNALLRSAARGGVPMSVDDAEQGIRAWREAYRGLKNYQYKIVDRANEHDHKFESSHDDWGHVIGLSGRRLFMRKKPNFNDQLSVYSPDACAFFWTGTEADIIKYAAKLIQDQVDAHPEWDCHIGNICHDEIDVECLTKYEPEVSRLLFDSMQTAMGRWVKCIPVDEEGATPEDMAVESYASK